MQLMVIDGMIVNASIPRMGDIIDPKRAAQVLIDDRQLSPALALSISFGAFLRRQSVIRLAQSYRLVSYDAVSSAKAAGLLV